MVFKSFKLSGTSQVSGIASYNITQYMSRSFLLSLQSTGNVRVDRELKTHRKEEIRNKYQFTGMSCIYTTSGHPNNWLNPNSLPLPLHLPLTPLTSSSLHLSKNLLQVLLFCKYP